LHFSGTTTTLARHLESEHPESYKQGRRKTQERRENDQKKEDEMKRSAVLSVSNLDAKSSLVWKHFRQESPSRISCLHCGTIFKTLGGSTSSALRHLRKSHPDKVTDAEEEAEEDAIWQFFTETDSEATCKQCDESVSISDDRAEMLDHLRAIHGTDVSSADNAVVRRVKFTTPDGVTRPRAVVWNYFNKTADKQVHSCKACLKMFKGPKKNNYSVMVRHLKVAHSRLHRQFLLDCGHSEEKIEELLVTKKRGRKKRVTDEDDASARTCPDCGKVPSFQAETRI